MAISASCILGEGKKRRMKERKKEGKKETTG